MIRSGTRTLKIKSARKSRLYGNWYDDLIGHEFEAIIYDIVAAEYTVKHDGQFRKLADEDVEAEDCP